MTSPVLTIEHDENIQNAAKKIYANEIGSLLVTQNQIIIGIVTKTDLMIKVLAKNLDAESTLVAEVMTLPLISIDAEEPLDTARKLMRKESIRHLAVSRENQIVGVLSVKDIS